MEKHQARVVSEKEELDGKIERLLSFKAIHRTLRIRLGAKRSSLDSIVGNLHRRTR